MAWRTTGNLSKRALFFSASLLVFARDSRLHGEPCGSSRSFLKALIDSALGSLRFMGFESNLTLGTKNMEKMVITTATTRMSLA